MERYLHQCPQVEERVSSTRESQIECDEEEE